MDNFTMNVSSLPSFREIVSDVLRQHACKFELYLNFSGCRAQVFSNSSELIKTLRQYYRGFVCERHRATFKVIAIEAEAPDFGLEFTIKSPDPGKTKVKEEYIDFTDGRLVRKRLTDMEFMFDHDFNLAIGPARANSNQIINFINNRYIQWRLNQGCVLLHASAVRFKGRGIAICGFSGAGKSTLALHLMESGAKFISNDRLMVRSTSESLMMFGVAKLPRINPGTILNNAHLIRMLSAQEKKKYSQMSPEELWTLESKRDADIHRLFGPGKFELSTDLNDLLILNWKRGAGEFKAKKIDLKKRKDLWPSFMKDVGLFFQATLPNYFSRYSTPQAYLQQLANCQVYEFFGGVDFNSAREFLATRGK